jgi:hypothetical protein
MNDYMTPNKTKNNSKNGSPGKQESGGNDLVNINQQIQSDQRTSKDFDNMALAIKKRQTVSGGKNADLME